MAQNTISANLRPLNGRYVIPLEIVSSCIGPPETTDLYAPHNFERVLDNGNGKMCPVVDQSRNIILGHLWKLFLKNALQSSKDDKAFPLPIIVHHSKFNFAISFFDHGGLMVEMC